jgi:DNA integrity scanning protein DisA with diadenylate cyclase activity
LVRSGSSGTTSDWLAIGEAAFSLAATHRGALIVLSGKQSLKNLLTGGVPLDGAISKEILARISHQ